MKIRLKRIGRTDNVARRVSVSDSDDTLHGQREALLAAIEDGGEVEFNTLTPTGKQAALSLENQHSARIVQDVDRLLVKAARNSLFQFFTGRVA